MTSQRDETVGHGARDETVGRMASDEMTDDPIVVERHDEILGGPPADDPEADDVLADPKADDASARDAATDDSTPAGGKLASEPAGDELASDELAGDELVGRHAVPETGRAGLEQDPPPLVVPPGPAPDDLAAPSGAATSGAQPAVPEPEPPVTPGTGPTDPTPADATPVDATPVDASPVATGLVDAGTPATSAGEPAGPNGDGLPAAALAGQQWPAIQAMFVDDPKGSVERAAAAADEVAKAFVASLQREQTALRAAWEKDTTTEDLRTALQQYRAFCGRLEGLA
jgi:hypothetical protein